MVILQILLYVNIIHKAVKISKLSSYFTLQIKLESKGKYIQIFLILKDLSIFLFGFPLIKTMIKNLFSFTSELVLILDPSQ